MPLPPDRWPLLLVAVLLLLVIAVWLLLRARRDQFPYELKPVLTDPERHFHTTLRQALPPGTLLLMKVRLADFLEITVRNDAYLRHFGRISQKHTDFLVVDAETLTPLLAIELDDSSHRHSLRTRESDTFKELAYQAAGLPLLRVPLARKYDRSRLREVIQQGLRSE